MLLCLGCVGREKLDDAIGRTRKAWRAIGPGTSLALSTRVIHFTWVPCFFVNILFEHISNLVYSLDVRRKQRSETIGRDGGYNFSRVQQLSLVSTYDE